MTYCRRCRKEVRQVLGSGIECPICETTLSFEKPKPKPKSKFRPKPKPKLRPAAPPKTKGSKKES